MKDQARPVSAMTELPEETRAFLARLRPEDLTTLEDGVRLVGAIRTVGKAVRWLIVIVVGTVVGTVMFYENVVKLINGVRHWLGG